MFINQLNMFVQLFNLFGLLKQPHLFALIHDAQAAYINSSKQLLHFKLLNLFEWNNVQCHVRHFSTNLRVVFAFCTNFQQSFQSVSTQTT